MRRRTARTPRASSAAAGNDGALHARMTKRMDPESIRRGVASFPHWYHRIELPGGVVTPGHNPINAPSYGIPDDLTGKRVLDVGAWDGFWTFEALKRGAR